MTDTYEAPPDARGSYEPLGAAELVDHDANGVRLRAGTATVEVTALAPDLFRVGMFPAGRPVSYDSEAIAKHDWETVEVSISGDKEVSLATAEATARLQLDPLRLNFTDASGNGFAADDRELGMGVVKQPTEGGVMEAVGDPVRLYKRRKEGEHYFGCGERTSGLEKTGSYQVFYNVDPPAGHTAAYSNLYASVPFYLSIRDGRAHGVFFDNTHRVELDLANENEERSYFGAGGGDVVYYVFTGPTPGTVLDRYTELTGRTPMPPLWALGNQQSRWSYETEDEVREIARQFRERDIPCDTIYLDIDYMDAFKVFTWNKESFPEPEKLISDLKDQGFNVVTIVDPGVKVEEGYHVYEEGVEKDFYCKTQENEDYHNVVWPGLCAFPDFTSPEAREWWGEKHRVTARRGGGRHLV